MDDLSIEEFERMVQWRADREDNPEQSPFDAADDNEEDEMSEDELVKFVERFLVEHPPVRHE